MFSLQDNNSDSVGAPDDSNLKQSSQGENETEDSNEAAEDTASVSSESAP